MLPSGSRTATPLPGQSESSIGASAKPAPGRTPEVRPIRVDGTPATAGDIDDWGYHPLAGERPAGDVTGAAGITAAPDSVTAAACPSSSASSSATTAAASVSARRVASASEPALAGRSRSSRYAVASKSSTIRCSCAFARATASDAAPTRLAMPDACVARSAALLRAVEIVRVAASAARPDHISPTWPVAAAPEAATSVSTRLASSSILAGSSPVNTPEPTRACSSCSGAVRAATKALATG